jgi:hypothetical protein
MKRVFLCFSFPAALCLISLCWLFFEAGKEKSVQYSSRKASAETMKEVCRERAASDDEMLQSIKFNGYELSFDHEKKRWYYSIVEDCETSGDPDVSWVSSDKNTEIWFEDRELGNLDDIEGNVPISVIAYNDVSYEKYELVCTTLPIVEIEVGENPFTQDENVFVNDTGNASYDYLSDAGLPIKYIDTNISIQVFDNRSDCANRVVKSDATAHIRGSSSVLWEKKSYKISLVKGDKKNKLSLLGMRTDDDWILYSGATDGERIRNVFSTNLWYETCAGDNPYGIDNGTQGEYVELFVNGIYQGLYALMYPADSKQFGGVDYLYRQEDGVSDLRFLDVTSAFSFRGAAKDLSSEEQWAPLMEYRNLFFADSDTFENSYENMVYIDNAMDIWLFVHLTLGVDNLGKNINYIARYDSQKDGYCMLFSPWDMDRTWGLGMINPNNTLEGQFSIEVYSFGISRMLVEDETFRTRLVEKYAELREKLWSDEAIMSMLEVYTKQIWKSGAMLREQELYGQEEDYFGPMDDTDMLSFKDFVQGQLDTMDDFMFHYLDEYIEQLRDYYVRADALLE